MPFSEGDRVRLKAPVIEGPITDIVYDKGAKSLSYLVEYTDGEGHEQQRWFAEAELDLVDSAPAETPAADPAAATEE